MENLGAAGDEGPGPAPRGLRKLPMSVLASVLVFAALTGGCGQGFDRDDAVAGFSAANPDATPEQSECVVDRLVDSYGLDGLEAELSAEPAAESFEEAQFREMFTCGVEGDVRLQITRQLEANNVSPDDAPCVADILVDGLSDADIDVLLSGEISDEFFAKFVSAMEECGAINP